MNIFVLSDIHIDTFDNLSTFQWDEKDFIDQIEIMRYRYSIDKVIFNGDTFELLKYRFEDIAKANPLLIKYLQNSDFIFIKGNHDILNNFGTDNYQITNSLGQTIHIEHGHNADWFNGTRIGHIISKLGFFFLKKLSSSKSMMELYFKLITLNEQVNQIPKKYNTLKYLTYALRLLKEHDVVILAHTHKLESHHTYYLNKKKRYLNCGSCSLGRFQGIVMDTETFQYELIKEVRGSFKEAYLIQNAI